MNEMNKLHEMLLSAHIPHTFMSMEPMFGPNSLQICIYFDKACTHKLDDVVFNRYSHGHELGLLETYSLGGCAGYETAEQVFEGWKIIFNKFNGRG